MTQRSTENHRGRNGQEGQNKQNCLAQRRDFRVKRAGPNVNPSANPMGLDDLVRSQTNLPACNVTGCEYHQRVDDVPRVGRDG